MSTRESREAAAQSAVFLYWVTLAEDGVEMEPRVPFVPSMGYVELEITRQFVCDTILVFERRRGGQPVLISHVPNVEPGQAEMPGTKVLIVLSDGRTLAMHNDCIFCHQDWSANCAVCDRRSGGKRNLLLRGKPRSPP
jgi:hypothetical protein